MLQKIDNELIEAVKTGDVEVVKKVLKKKEIEINIKDSYGYTSLHWAALEGYLNIVEYLIENNANINEKDKGGKTPLHYAVFSGHLNIVEYLLDHGADPNLPDDKGKPLLHNFLHNILANFPRDTTFNKKIIEILLLKKAKINLKDNEGNTPLHIISSFMHNIELNPVFIPIYKLPSTNDKIREYYISVTELLLNNHANPFIKGINGKTIISNIMDNCYLISLSILEQAKLLSIIRKIWVPKYADGAVIGMFMDNNQNPNKYTLIPEIASRIATFVDGKTIRNVALTCKSAAECARAALDIEEAVPKHVNKKQRT